MVTLFGFSVRFWLAEILNKLGKFASLQAQLEFLQTSIGYSDNLQFATQRNGVWLCGFVKKSKMIFPAVSKLTALLLKCLSHKDHVITSCLPSCLTIHGFWLNQLHCKNNNPAVSCLKLIPAPYWICTPQSGDIFLNLYAIQWRHHPESESHRV